jgi:hypothetical protein
MDSNSEWKPEDQEELEDAIWSNAVDQWAGDDGRWTRAMTTVVKPSDGRDEYYRIRWQQGLTESQENEYDLDDVKRVYPHRTVRASSVTDWTESEQTDDGFTDDIRSFLAVARKEAVDTIPGIIDDAVARSDYSGLQDLSVDVGMENLRLAAIAYTDKLKQLKAAAGGKTM